MVIVSNKIPRGDDLRSVAFAGLTPIDRHAERERLRLSFTEKSPQGHRGG
jgi:hypothetical protein